MSLKVLSVILAIVLGLIGLLALFAASQANFVPRFVLGLICLGASGAMLYLVTLRPIQQQHIHQMKLDVPGDISLQQIQCKQCGGELSSRSVQMAEGAIFITCEYCGAQYQMEEQAKW
jgi:hypothetical protein